MFCYPLFFQTLQCIYGHTHTYILSLLLTVVLLVLLNLTVVSVFFPFPLHVHTECKYLQKKRARCKYTVGKTSLFLLSKLSEMMIKKNCL